MKPKFNPPEYYWKIAKEYIVEKDIELQEDGKYYIDKQLAYQYIKFGSLLKHTAGSYAGANFQFQEWQIIAIVDIFGIKHAKGEFKGLRRYQKSLFFMPKKNGKSEFGALLHLLVFFVDKEKSKKQYCIGKSLDQAKLVHGAAVTMLKQEEDLNNEVHITKKPPRITKMDGAFEDEIEALASDADNQEGKNVSFFTTDEGHTHPNKDVYQIMTDGTAGRDEPLEMHLSTAGYNMQGYFYRDVYQYAVKVQQGIIKDDAFYPVLFELSDEEKEDEDFWKNEELWIKANPNLGKSPTYSYMRNKVILAEQSEESLIAFKTKHLNVWCDKADVWIKHSIWTANQIPINENDLIGKKCFGGLDLATNRDLAALILVFPDDSLGYRRFDVIQRYWIPKDNMRERARIDKVPYLEWYKKDMITATEGNIIDYQYIENEIKAVSEKFDIKMIAYDRHNSSDLVRRLTDEEVVELIPFAQTAPMFNPAINEIEVLSYKERLNHGDSEILNWQCSNVVLYRDGNNNAKMDKAKSSEKIDGMVALAMALGICILDTKEQEKEFIYNERGLLDI